MFDHGGDEEVYLFDVEQVLGRESGGVSLQVVRELCGRAREVAVRHEHRVDTGDRLQQVVGLVHDHHVALGMCLKLMKWVVTNMAVT